jgi:hypothetical protein
MSGIAMSGRAETALPVRVILMGRETVGWKTKGRKESECRVSYKKKNDATTTRIPSSFLNSIALLSMVAISPPTKVLVTGANGFLAVYIVEKYLEAGYSVRGTVRSLSRSAFLTDRFSNYGDRFELVVVEDITKEGAFDEAVRGVDAIAHTASPFHYKSTNPDGTFFFLLTLRKHFFG